MLHLLAYGNSDQTSFRDHEVRKCLDVLTVPSTIASYFPDATAAFVLSSQLSYMVEPRTPLFQEELREPRASHYTLASEMGDAIHTHLKAQSESVRGPSAYFPSDFYSDDVCNEMVASIVGFQRRYGGRAKGITDKLRRYRMLLEKVTGTAGSAELCDEQRGPIHVLCPYFAVRSLSDKWWDVMRRVWNAARKLNDRGGISPVVSMRDVSLLKDAVEGVPEELSRTVFFWIPGFDEKKAGLDRLEHLSAAVAELQDSYKLINLYGGYFSILLHKIGLCGFNNGLGYSESRDWPTLDSTGAAPARYYMRRLHAYVPTATATALVETDRAFACDCSVCSMGRLPTDLDYHELKKHFAMSRAWEINRVKTMELADLCSILREDRKRCEKLKEVLPHRLRIPVEHLSRWAQALDSGRD